MKNHSLAMPQYLPSCFLNIAYLIVFSMLATGCNALAEMTSLQNQLPQLPLTQYDQHQGQELIIKFKSTPKDPRDKRLFVGVNKTLLDKMYFIRPMAGDNFLYGIAIPVQELDASLAILEKSSALDYVVKNGRVWLSK